ncbi:hypothetical protein ZIOFF_060517 [Zingiber officinale]|uniref:Nop domain-containing protein n=1 Tax=Zingiber officinale TaxID=94328 RepID=A0A8J5FAW7_ZINOF|nr:hypothetical protein ZIOFF_060517 [Zingiber officinale]
MFGNMQALFRALKTKHATPKYGLIFHASLVGQAAPKIKGKISRSLAAKTALAIRYDALGDGQDNSMGLENRAKLEARLRVLEGRELGHSAGSTKGKPKIEFYDKDRKKGAGALITPAKTYNSSADLVLSQATDPTPTKPASEQEAAFPKKRKRQETEPTPTEKSTDEALANQAKDEGEKRKKKKKKLTEVDNTDSPISRDEAEEQVKKKKKKIAKVENTDSPIGDPTSRDEAEGQVKKKKKKDSKQEAELVHHPPLEEEPSKKEKKKKKQVEEEQAPGDTIQKKKEKKKKDKAGH